MKNSSQDLSIKIISPTVHSVLDYVIVVLLLIAPSLFGLSGVFAFAAYALGVVHITLTVTTQSPGGLFEILPFRIHGLTELLIAIGLIISPWIFMFSDMPTERNFYLLLGIGLFATWFLTHYLPPSEKLDSDTSLSADENGLESHVEFTKEKDNTNNEKQEQNE